MSQNRFAILAELDKVSNKKVVVKKGIKKPIPTAVQKQRELRAKYNYCYRTVTNGNVENNTTLYITTGVAHAHQIKALLDESIEKAKSMPEVFGADFECSAVLNLVRRFDGNYMGYGFGDVTNPKLYYALIGCNVDGSDRAELVDDPNWKPPSFKKDETSWADQEDDGPPIPPKIRKELPPLIQLEKYEYDEQQKEHLQTTETHGYISISPAFITPGVNTEYDDCSLYVSEVPTIDYDFLYELFARYARYTHPSEDNRYYPRINIRKCIPRNDQKVEGKTGIFAIIEYAHPYDASFALCMLQKIRAIYHGKEIAMPVRYAFKNHH